MARGWVRELQHALQGASTLLYQQGKESFTPHTHQYGIFKCVPFANKPLPCLLQPHAPPLGWLASSRINILFLFTSTISWLMTFPQNRAWIVLKYDAVSCDRTYEIFGAEKPSASVSGWKLKVPPTQTINLYRITRRHVPKESESPPRRVQYFASGSIRGECTIYNTAYHSTNTASYEQFTVQSLSLLTNLDHKPRVFPTHQPGSQSTCLPNTPTWITIHVSSQHTNPDHNPRVFPTNQHGSQSTCFPNKPTWITIHVSSQQTNLGPLSSQQTNLDHKPRVFPTNQPGLQSTCLPNKPTWITIHVSSQQTNPDHNPRVFPTNQPASQSTCLSNTLSCFTIHVSSQQTNLDHNPRVFPTH